MKQKLLNTLEFILSFFPTRLPQGMTEFRQWADSVIKLADKPNNDSMVFSLASMVPYLSATTASKSKQFFVRCLKKAAANQIAMATMDELKSKQQERIKAEQQAAQSSSDGVQH